MTNHPRVTVLMSVWNAESTLEQAVDSILSQTFREFEFLIVDDGSSDNSSAILQRKAQQDHRIRVLSQENRGLTVALQRGIHEAKGEFVFRQDADDLSHPERIERMMPFLQTASIVVSGWENWQGNHRWVGRGEKFLTASPSNVRDLLLSFVNLAAHGTFAMRKSDALKVGGYRSFFEVAQDYDLLLRLKEYGGLAVVPEVLYTLRLHEESISQKKKAKQRDFAALAAMLAWKRRTLGAEDLPSNFEVKELIHSLSKHFPVRHFLLETLLSYRYR